MNIGTSRHRMSASMLAGLALIGSLTSEASAFVIDGSFEAAPCPPGWFVYNPGGSPWTHIDASGVTAPPSPFGAPTPPSGAQVAFLQSRTFPPQFSAFSQSITLPSAPSFTLSYLHSGRNYAGFTGNLTYEILIDSSVISTQSTTTGLPFTPVSIPFLAGAGAHTLTFRIHAMQPLGDNTAFFDDVGITAVPAPGCVALAAAGGLLALRRRR